MTRLKGGRLSSRALHSTVLLVLIFIIGLFYAQAQDSSISGSVQDEQKSQIAAAKPGTP
jgi:hypothetical protein